MQHQSSRQGVTLQVLAHATATPSPAYYTYKVKIINPLKKSDVIMRELHHFHSKFDGVMTLRSKLVEELKEEIPDTMSFKVGYLEGQKNKMSIATIDDIKAMYSRFNTGEITLWCEERTNEAGRSSKRKREEQVSSRYHEREDEVEDVFQELNDKHSDKYEIPKLKLWARMVASNIHNSIEEPPKIPAFGFGVTKKPRREANSFAAALNGAAVSFAKALSENSCENLPPANSCTKENSSCMSPGKVVELHRKYLEQLRYVQQLFKDDILNEAEFDEQKKKHIISSKATLN